MLLQKLLLCLLQGVIIALIRNIITQTKYQEGDEVKLDQRRIDILNYLLDYRGMNAKQMTAFIYLTQHYSISNLKQVQRELKGLEDSGYVARFYYNESINDDIGQFKTQKVSMYYLTKKGYTEMLEYYNVLQGQQGSGFLLTEDFVYGDIPYETFTPPQKLVDHHLMAINAFIQMVCYDKLIPHKTNLYASKRIGNNRLRPDAEALINNNVYYLEFDRYNENHEKLIEKFEGYAKYFETLTKEELSRQGKIVFVVSKDDGVDRRWNNILSAYYKGVGKFRYYISVSLCLEHELFEFFKTELDQKEFIHDFKRYLYTVNKGNMVWHHGDFDIVCYKNIQDRVEFAAFTHKYDSSLFLKYAMFKQFVIDRKLEYSSEALIITLHNFSEARLNLEHYNVPRNIVIQYNEMSLLSKKIIPYNKIVIGEYDKNGKIIRNSLDIYIDGGI